MRRIWIVLGALVVAAGAAGCGGDGGGGDRLTKTEYQQEVTAVGDTLSQSAEGLSGAFSESDPESLDQVADQIEQLEDAMNGAADELDDLNPPADAEAAHDKMVEGIRGFADDVGKVADAARDGNLKDLQAFSENFGNSESVKQIQEATEELQAKGYTLESG
jgi:hypothetical protein